jgi:hypothetical protein
MTGYENVGLAVPGGMLVGEACHSLGPVQQPEGRRRLGRYNRFEAGALWVRGDYALARDILNFPQLISS